MKAICPLCDAADGVRFDQRVRVPILLNRTYPSAAEARSAATGALAFTGCSRCGFVWNAAFDETAIAYDAHYENDQAHSAVFQNHIRDRAARVIALAPQGAALNVIEIGAGQGVFLRAVAEAAGARLGSAVGFDPACRGGPQSEAGSVMLIAGYYGADAAAKLRSPPNVVLSRHTIEHVPRPLDFLRAIRETLHAGVQVAIETPCVRWMFDNWAIQDFFYEHCSLFTTETLSLALRLAGFDAVSVTHVFGQQYLWAEARAADQTRPANWDNPHKPDFELWSRRKDGMIAQWRSVVEAASAESPTYLWGAGAKGITFTCMVDPDASRLNGLIDINPAKQGTFAAMTGCPIISPVEASPRPTIIVMNPNYEAEVRALCDDRDMDARVLVLGREIAPK